MRIRTPATPAGIRLATPDIDSSLEATPDSGLAGRRLATPDIDSNSLEATPDSGLATPDF